MRKKQLLILAAALLPFAAAPNEAAAVERTCEYSVRVNARAPEIASFPVTGMTVEGSYDTDLNMELQSEERLAREAAGETARLCARAAWPSERRPDACLGWQQVGPQAGEGRVRVWRAASLKGMVINTLCRRAAALGIGPRTYLRNVTVYLYMTDDRDRSTSCSFGVGDDQSRYFEIATHFAVGCISRTILTVLTSRWSAWHDKTPAELEDYLRAYCRTGFGFEHLLIEETERHPHSGAIRARFSCS